ncbi:hypothetical protein [Vibrio chemaguriensis]
MNTHQSVPSAHKPTRLRTQVMTTMSNGDLHDVRFGYDLEGVSDANR